MAFTVSDFQDLLRLLREKPEWQAELRQILIGEDLAAIHEQLRLEAEERRAFQVQTNAHFDRLEESQRTLESSMLALGNSVGVLAGSLHATNIHVAKLRGWALESRYRDRAAAYLGRKLAKLKPVVPTDIAAVRASDQQQQYSDEDWSALSDLDLLLKGQTLNGAGPRDVYVALEASAVVDLHDVPRAATRAALLSRAGLDVIPAVGGETILPAALEEARKSGVAVLTEGRISYWPGDA